MNRKLLVGVAVGILGVIILAAALLPNSDLLKQIMPENVKLPGSLSTISEELKPLEVKFDDISILSVTESEAILELKFEVSNPNNKTVLLEMISYNIYENDVVVGHGEIGERLSGQLASSNYFTVLAGHPLSISGKSTIKNTGKSDEFWSTLQDGTPKWKITGEAFYSTTSAFSGVAGSTAFEFTK